MEATEALASQALARGEETRSQSKTRGGGALKPRFSVWQTAKIDDNVI